jgi:hypothetical protein
VVLDAGHINCVPLNDAVNQVVHVEDGTAVRRVMIGGRVVVEDGRVTTVDLARVRGAGPRRRPSGWPRPPGAAGTSPRRSSRA